MTLPPPCFTHAHVCSGSWEDPLSTYCGLPITFVEVGLGSKTFVAFCLSSPSLAFHSDSYRWWAVWILWYGHYISAQEVVFKWWFNSCTPAVWGLLVMTVVLLGFSFTALTMFRSSTAEVLLACMVNFWLLVDQWSDSFSGPSQLLHWPCLVLVQWVWSIFPLFFPLPC